MASVTPDVAITTKSKIPNSNRWMQIDGDRRSQRFHLRNEQGCYFLILSRFSGKENKPEQIRMCVTV